MVISPDGVAPRRPHRRRGRSLEMGVGPVRRQLGLARQPVPHGAREVMRIALPDAGASPHQIQVPRHRARRAGAAGERGTRGLSPALHGHDGRVCTNDGRRRALECFARPRRPARDFAKISRSMLLRSAVLLTVSTPWACGGNVVTSGTHDAGQMGPQDSSTADVSGEAGMACGEEAPCVPPFETCLAVPGRGLACCHEQSGVGMCRPCDAAGACANLNTGDD
jgi:hypothetical protein